MKRRFVPLLLLAAGLVACGPPPAPQTRGIVLLIDTSGTYNRQMAKVKQIVAAILLKMQPKDSVAVARINTASFSEKNIIARQTFEDPPSAANQQKVEFKKKVGDFLDHSEAAPYTDITGGLLQAIEYLEEKSTTHKEILIFSDMEEELAPGYERKDVPLDLKGYDVIALNVTKLRSDNFDPRKYISRLESWKERVEKSGGRWRVINDVDHLQGIL